MGIFRKVGKVYLGTVYLNIHGQHGFSYMYIQIHGTKKTWLYARVFEYTWETWFYACVYSNTWAGEKWNAARVYLNT